MARPVWTGVISFGLVSVPVKAYTATRDREIHFHQIDKATGVPILVSEHGVGTDDDSIRAAFIPAALTHLKAAIDDGVPVLGYCHWSLIDNFEWIFGYKPKFGLASYDPVTFARTPKPSAAVLGAIARANRV